MVPMARWIVLGDDPANRVSVDRQKARLYRDFQNNTDILVLAGVKPGSNSWRRAMRELGYISSKSGRLLFKPITPKDSLKLSAYKAIWPGAYGLNMPLAEIGRKTVRTQEAAVLSRDVQQELQNSIALGRNLDGDMVYGNALGRFIYRGDKPNAYEKTGTTLREAFFLRASDDRARNECADGFVQSLQSGVMREADIRRFTHAMTGVNEEVIDSALLEKSYELIDAAIVRHLANNYRSASDAYGACVLLYERMPAYKGQQRGNGAMPIPLATIAQRLMGDTQKSTVIYPNAYDGAAFSLLPQGTLVQAFSGAKSIEAGKEIGRAEVQWGQDFDAMRDANANALFFNADAVEDAQIGARSDYAQALVAIGSLAPKGRAVLVLKGDDAMHPGVLSAQSRKFLETLSARYTVQDAFEVGRSLQHGVGTNSTLRVITLQKEQSDAVQVVPQALPTLHTWDEINARVAESLAQYKVKEVASEFDDEEIKSALQSPYVAFSKVGEAQALVPKELQQPLNAFMSSLEAVRGPVDDYVRAEMGLAGDKTLAQRFSAEQVDVLSMAMHRMQGGRGHILADETGIGKGRVLAGLSAWTLRQERPVVFVTDKAHLFSSFATDMRDIDEWGRVRPLIMNAGATMSDNVRADGILAQSLSTSEMRRIVSTNMPLKDTGCNMIFTTYSQLSGEDSPKAQWLKEQLPNALLILDEAHLAAGASSNISTQISEMTSLAWAVEYSSATWAKSPENMHIFARALPESVNVATLTQTMKTGGPAWMELFSAMLARDGAFRRLEHDMSKVPIRIQVDVQRLERNRLVADNVAGVMSAIMYVAGGVRRMATRVTDANTAALREASLVRGKAQTAKIFKSKFGAGDMLYKIQTQLNTALNVDNVADMAIEAMNRGQKPVIVFEDTAEADIVRGMKDVEPDDQGRLLIPTPTIRDLLLRIVKNVTHVRTAELAIEDLPEGLTPEQMRAQLANLAAQDDAQEQAVLQDADQQDGLQNGEATDRQEGGPQGLQDPESIELAPVSAAHNAPAPMTNADMVVPDGFVASLLAPTRPKIRYVDIPMSEVQGLTQEEREAFERGIQEINRLIMELEPVPLNALDQLTQRLNEARLDSGVAVRVGEISGRNMYMKNITVNGVAHCQVLKRLRSKDAVQSTVRGFNGGDIDVLMINRSAATGISLHASERASDQRQRFMAFMQIPRNPTDLIQLLGRVNRTGQVNTPEVVMASTGIIGELRNMMMQQQKIAKLNSTARGERRSNLEMSPLPDLLSPLGREVCRQFLEDNPEILFKLDLPPDCITPSSGIEVEQLLTSRIGMLKSAEAEQIYAQLCTMFDDAVMQAELAGENPLRPNELDVRAKMGKSKLLFGWDNQGLGSTFDGPVYTQELTWRETVAPMKVLALAQAVRQGREALVAAGHAVLHAPQASQAAQAGSPTNAANAESATTPAKPVPTGPDWAPGMLPLSVLRVSSGHDICEDVDMSALVRKTVSLLESRARLSIAGSDFKTVQEAMESPTTNAVRRGMLLAAYLRENLAKLTPGRIVSMPIGDHPDVARILRHNTVIVSVTPPAPNRLTQLSQWRIQTLSPGATKPASMSLRSLIGRITMHADVSMSANGQTLDALNRFIAVPTSRLEIGSDFMKTHELPADKRATASQNWIYRSFEQSFEGERERKATVLSGNAYLAAEWAAKTGAGKQVIYTDDAGARHRGILLKDDFKPEWIQYLPTRLWLPKMLEDFVQRLCDHEVDPLDGRYTLYGTFDAAWKSTESSSARQVSGKDQILMIPGHGVMMFTGKEQRAKVNQMLRNAQKSIKSEQFNGRKVSAQDDPGHVLIKETKKRAQDLASTGRAGARADDAATGSSRKNVDFVVLAATTPEQMKRAFEMIRRGVGLELWVAAPAGDNNAGLNALAKRCVESYFVSQARAACSNESMRERLDQMSQKDVVAGDVGGAGPVPSAVLSPEQGRQVSSQMTLMPDMFETVIAPPDTFGADGDEDGLRSEDVETELVERVA